MKKRTVNKKNLMILLSGVFFLLIIIVFLVCLLIQSNKKVVFFVDGEKTAVYHKTIEFERGLELNSKFLKVKATFDGEDISKSIENKVVKVNELKIYTVQFKGEGSDEVLICKIKVVDTTAPIVDGKNVYEIEVGSTFGLEQLELSIKDNYDEDFASRISLSGFDTTVVADYPIEVIINDSSNNKTVYPITLKVLEKVVINKVATSNEMEIPNDFAIVNDPTFMGVLVNKNNRLPEGWEPSDLLGIGGNHYLRREAANAWNSLSASALSEGVYIKVISTYRTQQYQQRLYNSYYANDPVGAPFYSAIARTSEHELGLAIDISYDSVLHNDLQNSILGIWMANNAHNYGFIMRYPYDKTNITQYMFEPWHYRYVGIQLATQLKNSNICLEEYY